jgi:hypothetical protein
VDWKKLVASLVWIGGVGSLDIAYIFAHGADLTAITAGIVALSPAWAYIARDVSFSFLGQKIEIKGSDIASAAKEVINAAPAAIKEAHKLAALAPVAEPSKAASTAMFTFDLHQFHEEPNATVDSRVLLISFRDEIVKRVNKIANLVSVPIGCFSHQTVKRLTAIGVFPAAFAAGLERLIRYGNAASDGAKISEDDMPAPSAYRDVLGALDKIIEELNK